jgi:CheY-like chemotaxis protein
MSSVMLVDDSKHFRDPLAAALRRRGIDVTCAENGIEALEKLRTAQPDIILLDLMMPQMDGLSVLRALRLQPKLRSIPVLLLTGHDHEHVMVEAKSLGAQCLLKYCVTLDELCSLVRLRLTHSTAAAS